MRRLTFILLALTLCVSAFGQAFTPRRPFITASSGAWTPLNLPSIQYWWVATDIASNSIVTNWIDRIASFPASQDVDARRPTNSLNGVYFNGSNYLTNNPYNVNWAGVTNGSGTFGTIYVICRPSANNDFAGIVTGGHSGSDGYGLRIRTPTFLNFAGGCVLNGHNFTPYVTNFMYDIGITLSDIFACSNDEYTNGVFIQNINDGTIGRFEAFGTSAGGNNYIGYVTEIMSFTTNLDQSSIDLLHNYATNTYWSQYQNYALPISITVHPVSVSCLTNYITSFSITQSGASSFQWRTNSVNVSNGNRWAGANTSTLWVTNDSTLFTNLSVDCVLTNLLYAQTSAVAYLTVMNDAVTNGLVGWWRFDEGAGTTTADSSGTGNGGHLTNSPPWVTGHHTNALYFPFAASWGVCPLVRVTNSASLNSFTAVTLAGWAYVTNSAANGDMINKKTVGEGNAPSDPYSIYELWATATNAFVGFATTSAGSRKSVQCAFPNSLNTWCHYAGAYDGTFITLYQNGVLLTNYNAGSFTVGSNGIPLTLGAAAYSTAGLNVSLVGFGDDFRVYNRALTTNEVQALYRWTGPQQ